ncbi:MAG: hypothetical protein KC613_26970 [Myxococcales bacterium]|nr:hypothetical protein [Myxococcales bacterium]MCB9522384.1 hypothetical protein [Myxococcales bacterium]
MASAPIILGPQVIASVGQALDTLMPWLVASRFRILETGNLEFEDPEPAEAIKLLRSTVETFLPEATRAQLGRSSGLGWNVFFGHVVTWWLPQRSKVGFLRALVDRAALHRVALRIHWNEDEPVPVIEEKPGKDSLLWGAVAGLAVGLLVMKIFRTDALLTLLLSAGGFVAGRIWQRIGTVRVCGDPLCHAHVGRAKRCPTCGGLPEDRI